MWKISCSWLIIMVGVCGCWMCLMLMIDTHWYAWSKHTVAMCDCYLWLMLLLDIRVWCSWLAFVVGPCMVITCGWCSWVMLLVGHTWWVLEVDISAWYSLLVLMVGVCCASWLVSTVVTYRWTPLSLSSTVRCRLFPICLLWTMLLLLMSMHTNVPLFFSSKLQQCFPPNFRYCRKYLFCT